MFGIGSTEFVIILIVALVLIGPQKLPDIMKAVGKGIGELRRMSSDVKTTIEREIEKADELKRIEETKKELFGDDADKIKQSLTDMGESVTAAVAGPARELMATAEQGVPKAADAAGNTELTASAQPGLATDTASATPEQDAATADQSAPSAGQASGAAPQSAAAPGAPAQSATATPQPSQEKTHA